MVPYHRTFDAMAGMFGWMFNLAGIESIEGMDFLEIGTGQYINHPVCAAICGAGIVWTYDVQDNRVENYLESLDNIVMANRFLSGLVPQDRFKERVANIKQCADKVQFFYDLPNGQQDFIFSYSTLEHVPEREIDNLLLYMMKTSKKYTLHYIDTADSHRNNELSPDDWRDRFAMFKWHVFCFSATDGSYAVIRTSL